jgi:hypothetical protein
MNKDGHLPHSYWRLIFYNDTGKNLKDYGVSIEHVVLFYKQQMKQLVKVKKMDSRSTEMLYEQN